MMKRLLRRLGQGLLILAITLALDFVLTATLFSDLRAGLQKAEAENWSTYIDTQPFHHDLIPNKDTARAWGRIVYPWRTDRYGFRTGACAANDSDRDKPAVFVIGDSFVEAMGSSFEKSFLDLSDIDDDANVYLASADGTVMKAPEHETPRYEKAPFDLGSFLLSNFTSVRLVHDLFVASTFSHKMSVGRDRARWTVDPALMEQWGRRGLEVVGKNLEKIVALCRAWDCRLTLVVYPWPDNVVARDKDGVQVKHWRAWSEKHGVRFIDAFPAFFAEPPAATLEKYFIAGDVHFTDAGNRLLFEEVKRATAGQW